MIRVLLVALILVAGAGSAALAQSGLPKPKKGLSLQNVAQRQRSPVRQRLDRAIRALKNGAYTDAAVALYAFVKEERALRDEARYNLAKALYRMGVYRSALYYFADLLAQGPKNRYYRSSLEWCLFISRKMNDDDAVNEVVARFGGDKFPAEYRDEFLFRLARFHFSRAIGIERGEVEGRKEETRVEEKSTGGKSIKGDIFGDDLFDDPSKPKGQKKQQPKVAPPKGKGGISLDDDLFGDPNDKKKAAPADKPPPPKAKKAKQTRRRGKKRRRRRRRRKSATTPWVLTAGEHTAAAQRLIVRVNPESPFGPRAKFLEGVLLYQTGRPNEALEAFKAVVRKTRDDDAAAGLRQMAFFQLARTHFGAEQPSFSLFYYDRIDRDAIAWLDALYEGSWAEFRLGNYEKALGNLLTLHAPFFDDTYYPESLILKAVVYYENCRYPEAKAILDDFMKRYEPVHEELERLTSQAQSYEKYYEALEGLRKKEGPAASGEKAQILAQVLDIALSDPELERLDIAYREVDDELRRLRDTGAIFEASPLSERLTKYLKKTRDGLAKSAGRAVKNQLERERAAINLLIQQAIRIDIETARSEQERIESRLRAVQQRPKDVERTFVEWTDDEKIVWPFEGEYWRDELGTYELTLAHSCR